MQKIIIKNFRQISFAEVELRKIVLLTGKQASGKSTVAKLIYFFKSLKDCFVEVLSESGEDNFKEAFTAKVQQKFKAYFGSSNALKQDFEIVFYYDYTENKYLKLYKNGTLQIEFDPNFWVSIIAQTKDAIQQYKSLKSIVSSNSGDFQYFEEQKSRFSAIVKEQINIIFQDPYQPTFFPAGRNITVSYPEQFQALFLSNLYNSSKSVDMVLMKSFITHSKFLVDFFNTRTLEDLEISEYLQFFCITHAQLILQGKYENIDGSEKIVFDENKNAVPLYLASSGQQEAIRIIQDILYVLSDKQPVFRVYEEPEGHLYPESQRKLIELMCLLVNTTNSQIIITTHSPYVLSILNNLLMYSKVIERKPDKAKEIHEYFETTNLNFSKNQRINLLKGELEAYILDSNADNYCLSIIDKETGLVGDNYLDNVTEELNNDFDVLYRLNFQK